MSKNAHHNLRGTFGTDIPHEPRCSEGNKKIDLIAWLKITLLRLNSFEQGAGLFLV